MTLPTEAELAAFREAKQAIEEPMRESLTADINHAVHPEHQRVVAMAHLAATISHLEVIRTVFLMLDLPDVVDAQGLALLRRAATGEP